MEKYHPVASQIKKFIEDAGIWHEVFEHEPVTTSEDASKVRTGYVLSQGVKALVVKAKLNNIKQFIMVCVPGDKKFSAEKLKKNFSITDTRFASEDEVAEITGGIKRGGVPPFGNLFGLPIFADVGIFNNDPTSQGFDGARKIIFNAGDRSFSVAMLSADWQKLVNPQVAEIAEAA